MRGFGALIVPACNDYISTYPGLLIGTVSSLETEHSRDNWEPNDQHQRVKDTNAQWIIRGKPLSPCSHQYPNAITTCDDISRIQTISQNSKFIAIFHRRQDVKSQLNVIGNVSTVVKGGMWSPKAWSDRCPECDLHQRGAVRFGKVCRCALVSILNPTSLLNVMRSGSMMTRCRRRRLVVMMTRLRSSVFWLVATVMFTHVRSRLMSIVGDDARSMMVLLGWSCEDDRCRSQCDDAEGEDGGKMHSG